MGRFQARIDELERTLYLAERRIQQLILERDQHRQEAGRVAAERDELLRKWDFTDGRPDERAVVLDDDLGLAPRGNHCMVIGPDVEKFRDLIRETVKATLESCFPMPDVREQFAWLLEEHEARPEGQAEVGGYHARVGDG